jgi:ribonuclease HI
VILPEVFEIRDSIPAAPQDVSEKPSSVNTEDPALPNAAELASTSALLSSLITPDDTKKDTEMENEAEGEIDLNTGQDVSADFLANVLSLSQGISSSVMSTPDAPLQVYSDGSDIKGTGKLGFGAVFEFKGKEYTISGTEVSPEVRQLSAKHPEAKFSNPTMEMLALVTALNSFKNTKEHIQINQDYKGAVNYGALWYYSEGSEQRESKPWNAKEPYIRTLVDAATTLIKQIEANGGSVKLKWVRGHAGNVMNEKADAAAKNRDIINTFKQATLEHGAEIIKPPGRPGIDLSDQDNCGQL